MQEQLISFETARSAKETGFNYDVKNYYNALGELFTRLYRAYKGKYYQAPTQNLLQKWLRDEHNVHINPVLETDYEYINKFYRYSIVTSVVNYTSCKIYNSYEEALEKGLLKALNLSTK